LGKTAGLTDAALNDRLRGTALYHVVMNATRDPRYTRLNVLQADASPSAAEIESRYPGMSAEQVEGLLEDYRSECMTLATYSVTNVYDRTIALVLEDFQRLV
jgi:nuclear pore complex protein Nup133